MYLDHLKPTYSQLVRETTTRGGLILFDGAIGTALSDRIPRSGSVPTTQYPDVITAWNPELLKSLHIEYLQAGVDVITTNTMLCNQLVMEYFDLDLHPRKIVQDAVSIARDAINEVGGKDRYIAGSIGPIHGFLGTDLETAVELVKDKATALLEAGVDLLLLESQLTLEELSLSIVALEKLSSTTPIQVHVTPKDEYTTHGNASLSDIFQLLGASNSVVACGFNCVSPELVPALCSTYLTTPGLALLPNVGPDKQHSLSPSEFGEMMESAIKDSSVTIVGGCCGTTPAHIESFNSWQYAISY